jgi:hypothetical protein
MLVGDDASWFLAASPGFRWGESGPPPDEPRAAGALASLVERLEQSGWRQTGRGEHWYELRFSRAAPPQSV